MRRRFWTLVADLVGDHVGLGEIARRVEPVAQLPVEREVDVHAAVTRAVERAHGPLGEATCGLYGAGEQDELRVFVGAVQLLAEHAGPRVLGVGQHHRDEVRLRIR